MDQTIAPVQADAVLARMIDVKSYSPVHRTDSAISSERSAEGIIWKLCFRGGRTSRISNHAAP
ncbi:MAG: hypothetical protein EA383_16450 [Spirochaetaceae bacterium]|nr:MAG: hypothetical protein EA383_16450 [Spirochaetaceae bacterium]